MTEIAWHNFCSTEFFVYSKLSSIQMHSVIDHQETMGILLPERTRRIALSTTQQPMPKTVCSYLNCSFNGVVFQVQTTDKPVVLCIAPKQIFTDKDSLEAQQKFAELNTH